MSAPTPPPSQPQPPPSSQPHPHPHPPHPSPYGPAPSELRSASEVPQLPPLASYGHLESDAGARDYRSGLLVAAPVALLGLAVGALWVWLAPRVVLLVQAGGVYIQDSEGEQPIGQDGMFALLGIGAGVLCAVAVFLARRRGGVMVVVGLAVGSLLGALLAWWFGAELLGPGSDIAVRAQDVPDGGAFDENLKLRAKAALLVWPMAAVLIHLALTAAFGPRDEPRPLPPLTHGPHQPHEKPAPAPGA